MLGCLLAAGFNDAAAVRAYSVQDAYIYGFALQQTDMSPASREDFAAVARRQMTDYASALPDLARVVGGYVAEHGYDYEEQFRFGLDLILDGLERLRRSGS